MTSHTAIERVMNQRLAQPNTCLHRMALQPSVGSAVRMWSEAVKDKAMKAVSCVYALNKCKKSAFQRSAGLTPVHCMAVWLTGLLAVLSRLAVWCRPFSVAACAFDSAAGQLANHNPEPASQPSQPAFVIGCILLAWPVSFASWLIRCLAGWLFSWLSCLTVPLRFPCACMCC